MENLPLTLARNNQNSFWKMGPLFHIRFLSLLCSSLASFSTILKTLVKILLHTICIGVALRATKEMEGDGGLPCLGDSSMEKGKHS